jgi:DNA polymerase III subunit alpha
MSFVHLNLHTQYSLLQGAIRPELLFARVKELGMDAVAVTDSQNLFGAIDFYLKAREAGVRPIIGCELQCAVIGQAPMPGREAAPPGSKSQDFGPRFHTLIALCKDLKGYQNLCRIVTEAYTQAHARNLAQASQPGHKGALPARALVERSMLEKWGEGLVILSGGLRGEIPYRLLMGDDAGAGELIQWLKGRFKDDFYLEIQDTGIPEQDLVNGRLAEIAARTGVELAGTANCHYLRPEDAES